MISCIMVLGNHTRPELSIHSYLQQTYADRELVIMNSSEDYLRRLQVKQTLQPYMSDLVYAEPVTTDPGVALLEGIELAKGDIVCPWRPDFVALPDWLQLVATTSSAYKFSGASKGFRASLITGSYSEYAPEQGVCLPAVAWSKNITPRVDTGLVGILAALAKTHRIGIIDRVVGGSVVQDWSQPVVVPPELSHLTTIIKDITDRLSGDLHAST